MQKVFVYDNVNYRVQLNIPELLLVREFAALLSDKRNITKTDKKGTDKTLAFKEFTYIFLALDWLSPYAQYDEQDRHEEAMNDSKLTQEEFDDPLFRAACRKYRAMQDETRSIKILKAAQNTVDKFIDYFNDVDPTERDRATGKPIFKVGDLMNEISKLSKVLTELKALEDAVKSEKTEQSTIRANAVEGFEDF